MSIGDIIEEYGKGQSPYRRKLVNHLPMGQFALYQLSGDLDKVSSYSKEYVRKNKINPAKKKYQRFKTIEEHLGCAKAYESCLHLIEDRLKEESPDNLLREILNTYVEGISSGVFHTIIRLAYALEGYKEDKKNLNELARALAYYITGYSRAGLHTRYIEGKQIKEEMQDLADNKHIQGLLQSAPSFGQGLKALYNDQVYLSQGFIIKGDEEDKVRALLDLLIAAYYAWGNIIALHAITGLHALVVLKDYFEDFSKALDILTTSIISHLLEVDYIRYKKEIPSHTELSWVCIKIKASRSKDVHAIKLTYSSYQLDKIYNIPGLKDIALKRIRNK